MSAGVLLEVSRLRIAFRRAGQPPAPAVRDVSFSVPRNSTLALVGESGSGKSVSALAVMGLLAPEQTIIDPGASIRLAGRELLAPPAGRAAETLIRGKDIAMIFQDPMSSLNPVFSIGFQISEVLRLHMGMGRRQARARAIALLEEVGLPDPARQVDAYPSQLSGGQQQRAMIAMAIASEPQLLIADEATTALDVTVQQQILALLADLRQRRGMALLFITHDLRLVAQIADHVVVMRAGEVREAGPMRQVLEQPQDDYTRALLHCRPPLDSRPWRLPVIAGAQDGAQHSVLHGSADGPPLLVVRQLSASFYQRDGWFGRRAIPAVKDVSFTLARGKTLGVVGESGSGKTTLGLTLLRLLPASGGSVCFDGHELLSMPAPAFRAYKRRLQIVFQNPYASLNPRFTVGQILLEPMRIHGIGKHDDERVATAQALVDKVGLPASAMQRYPHEFSGGQRQRIAIARCLTLRPEVLVCDESVSALDVSVQAQVLNLLKDLQDELGLSYIFISHDLSVVKYMADQVLVMQGGAAVELADAERLYRDPQHPTTRALLAATGMGFLR